jgi:hypothetical protein
MGPQLLSVRSWASLEDTGDRMTRQGVDTPSSPSWCEWLSCQIKRGHRGKTHVCGMGYVGTYGAVLVALPVPCASASTYHVHPRAIQHLLSRWPLARVIGQQTLDQVPCCTQRKHPAREHASHYASDCHVHDVRRQRGVVRGPASCAYLLG